MRDRARATHIWNGNGADNSSRSQIPETQCIVTNSAQTGLQDREWNNVIRGQDEALLPVDTKTMRVKVVFRNV